MDNIGLVFDFDGTMCRLFKLYDLSSVVIELHNRMQGYGFDFPIDKDAFEIFEFINEQSNLSAKEKTKLHIEMDSILTAAEIEAVKNCELVNGVSEVLPLLKKTGYILGVATNNSHACVLEFLKLYCNGLDLPIVGRVGSNPELMKPNKWSLIEVLKKMNCDIKNAIFFGDTKRDYECSLCANCKFIGVAPTQKKRERLQLIKPKIEIVTDFYELKNFLQ